MKKQTEMNANFALHAYAVQNAAIVGRNFAKVSRVVRPAKPTQTKKILSFFRITSKN